MEDALSVDYEKLRQELIAEGYFNPNLRHVFYRIAEVVLMYYAMVACIWHGYYWSGVFVGGIAQGRCGWLQHEGGHYSFTGMIKLDRHLQMFIYGVGCGMSGCYWRNQHNKHHAVPQKLGADPDLQTLPLLAFHKIIGKKGNKSWLKLQAPLFFGGVITTLVAWGWQFVQHPNHALRVQELHRALLDGRALHALAPDVWLHGPRRVPPPLRVVRLRRLHLHLHQLCGHAHTQGRRAEEKHISWSLYSANHTTNCSNNSSSTGGWLQIEHHRRSSPRCRRCVEE